MMTKDKVKLFKLTSIDFWDYDSNLGFVIRAADEQEARQLAQSCIADEKYRNKEFWLNSEYSSCAELKVDGESEIILTDFQAG